MQPGGGGEANKNITQESVLFLQTIHKQWLHETARGYSLSCWTLIVDVLVYKTTGKALARDLGNSLEDKVHASLIEHWNALPF